jgi:hypothetical protein
MSKTWYLLSLANLKYRIKYSLLKTYVVCFFLMKMTVNYCIVHTISNRISRPKMGGKNLFRSFIITSTSAPSAAVKRPVPLCTHSTVSARLNFPCLTILCMLICRSIYENHSLVVIIIIKNKSSEIRSDWLTLVLQIALCMVNNVYTYTVRLAIDIGTGKQRNVSSFQYM